MLPRRLAPLLALALLAGLTACSPATSPDPSPTYRQFTSEDEAFEAAEETYRAYIAAGNTREDGVASGDPLRFLKGKARADSKQLAEALVANGLHYVGSMKILSLSRKSASVLQGAAQAELTACLDGTEMRLHNEAGEDVTPTQNPVFGLHVQLASERGEMLIYQSSLDESAPC